MSAGYKDLSGIYTITNIVNNKIYCGSCTTSIFQRFGNHKRELRKGTHTNLHLQNAWNKYGEEAFSFDILEEHSPELCLGMEQYWMNLLDVCNRNKGYNIAPVAGNSYGQKRTLEQRKNISKATTGKRKGKLNPRYGTTWSKETRYKIENSTRNKAVIKLDLDNNIIEEYKSLSEAGKMNNLCSGHIGKVCNNKPNHLSSGGFKWKFKNG